MNATASSVDLSWIASIDNVGVAGYGVYVNGSLVGSTAATTFTVTGLSCGSTYTFGVDAYDKRRNRSVQLVFTGATAGCPTPAPSPSPQPGPSPQPADTTPPTQPAGLTTTGVTTSSMTLAWGASTDNVAVAGYEISTAGAVAGTTSSTSYLLTGLSCGTTYALAVQAYDAAGNRSEAATISVATSACAAPADTQPPSVPANLHVTSATVSSISVAWNAATDNVGVTGYGVYRGGTLAGSTNATTYTLSGLACGTAFSLGLDAYDAAGNHSAQATLTTSTSACPPTADTSAPTTPTGLQATAATPASITIAWTGSTDNVGVAGYTAYNGSNAAGSTTSTSYTISGLLCGATYSLGVDAFDAAGNRSSKATISSSTNACAPPPPATDTQAPTTPSNLQVLSATANSISVTWTASTDNVAVTGYGLYRGGASTGSTNSTSATFSGLTCGSAYTLGVDAYDAAGNRSTPATITASASPCPPTADTQAPTTPGGLHVTGATTDSITVAWTASTDNIAVTGYGLYRGSTSTGSTTSTSATFTGLSCGTTYTLAVDAYDAAGNRSAQANISSPTSACPAPPPPTDSTAPTAPSNLAATSATTSSISVSWSASTDNVGVSGYGLYRGGNSTGSTNATNATFSGLTCGTAYTLAVDAYDAAGNRSSKTSITTSTSACPPTADTQPPTVPSGLTATSATANSISVGWNASTDNVAVTGYGLYRNSTSTGSTSSTSASFSSLSCGTAYTLAVDAYDAAGNRSGKATITASTGPCPPPADTQAPTVPGGLHATTATANSITVAWTASTDNVGVTGYGVYNGSSTAGSTASTSYTLSGLSCGTGYTLAVDAYDAAGNRSGKTTISATTSTCPTAGGYQHVVWVVMENHSYSQIIGNTTSAPYINQLAQQYGSATQMFAETHPSLPNYVAMTSGSPQGIADDNPPSSHPLNVANIFAQLGTNARSLEESMPSNCLKTDSGDYVVKHNPAAYYTNYTQCSMQNVPLGSTPDLSAGFTDIEPNNCHTMHSNSCAGSGDPILQGDQFLQAFVPKLLATPQYQAGNTVIFITWDEDDSSTSNRIPTIVISPTTKNISSATTFNHYSMLRTTEELLGITNYIGNAATASSMRSDFHL